MAFSGDGAFNMNPGMLFVERQLDLPNLKHFMVSNRCYGSTNELAMPFSHAIDYAAMARAAGLKRVYSLTSLDELERQLDEIIKTSRPHLHGAACRAARPPRCLAAVGWAGGQVPVRALSGAQWRPAHFRHAATLMRR